MTEKTDFIVLDRVAEKLNLKIRNCGEGHFQVLGGKYEVSFYPFSRRKMLYFRHQDMSATIRHGTWEMALELANRLPQEGNIRAHKKNKRRKNGYSRHKEILLRSDPHCYLCRIFLTMENGTIDHVIPLSLGGRNDFKNLRLACVLCNRSKGNTLIEE